MAIIVLFLLRFEPPIRNSSEIRRKFLTISDEYISDKNDIFRRICDENGIFVGNSSEIKICPGKNPPNFSRRTKIKNSDEHSLSEVLI